MKTKYIVSILGLLAITAPGMSSAMAADSDSGPYIAGAIGQKSTTFQESFTTDPPFSFNQGDTSFFGQISGGYGFDFGNGFKLRAGLFYDLGNGNAGSISLGGVGASTSKEKGRYGVAIEPGYALSRDATTYLKLTYNWARVTQTDSDLSSQNFSGFGYGLGLRYMVNKNVYVYGEWQEVDYGSKTTDVGDGVFVTIKPKTTLGLFGVGYKF